MPSLRLVGLATFAAFAAANSIATPQDQVSTSTVKRQSDAEATGCHAHGDTLFCIYEGEEWEVTSDVDVNSAPDSYSGCHTHGAGELHCDGDVMLALESESSSEDSHSSEDEHDHSHGSESTSADEITEVTDCHNHGDELFCMAGSEEWEVTTEFDADNAPTSISGCHAHGEDELHCTEGDTEFSLTRAAAESHSSSSASGEAVDCHAHAGVEHCVDADGNTVDMGCDAPNHDYDVPLRIGLLFVILATSAIGVFAPILTERFTSVSMDGIVIVAMRQFGTGVVISTAIVHLFTHSMIFFDNKCLTNIDYEATPGAILLAGLFLTFCIEYIAHRWVDKKRHMFEKRGAVEPTPGPKEASDANISEASSAEHSSYSPASLMLNTSVMEAGIIFHSILIGLTLVVAADSGFITLFIVIIFHQVFEGFALGSRIAMIPCGLMRKSILATAFSITTPIGMAIGIGVLSSFNGNDPSTIIAIGTLNAFSAGILLWVGVAEMWFVEWFHGPLAHAGPLKAGICFVSLVAGIVLMSFLGKWA